MSKSSKDRQAEDQAEKVQKETGDTGVQYDTIAKLMMLSYSFLARAVQAGVEDYRKVPVDIVEDLIRQSITVSWTDENEISWHFASMSTDVLNLFVGSPSRPARRNDLRFLLPVPIQDENGSWKARHGSFIDLSIELQRKNDYRLSQRTQQYLFARTAAYDALSSDHPPVKICLL